jgi:hypothetical protein
MPSLAQVRCYHHVEREAVARCPSCGHCYCRECITEHDDRILCAACLTKLTRPSARKKMSWVGLGYLVGGGMGLFVAWFFFYLLGHRLLDLPTAFHQGTLWMSR